MGRQPTHAWIKQFLAAAEAIDQQALHQGPLHWPQQLQGAHQLGKDAAPFDISHQQAAGPQVLGQAQIGEVAVLQVHLHWAAGSFQHQPAVGVLLSQLLKSLANREPSRLEPLLVVGLGPRHAN